MARNSTTSPPNEKSADAAVLQHQNQKLLQQIDIQKHELHDLEAKIKELKDKQSSYDDMLIVVNQLWNQLVDDLILLGVRAGAGQIAFEYLDRADNCRGSVPSCPAEEIFLCRLLQKDSIQANGNDGIIKYVEEALALRHSSTTWLLKLLEDTINDQRAKTKSIALALHGKLSSEGELDESMAELEESRRKLVNLQMQKDVVSAIPVPTHATANGNLSPEKPSDRTMGLRELKDSVDEAKNEMKDDKYVRSSRLYSLRNDQLQLWNAEAERYKADRPLVIRREKEVVAKIDSTDAVRNAIDNAESRIEELELQLQKCVIEKNDLEVKMEEALQDAGRKDIKSEFRVMASALSKEMGMMEAQLKRWKEAAHEALSLREEAQLLKAQLHSKTNEKQRVADKCAEQMVEIKSLKALIEQLQKEKLELQIFLDMYGQESSDSRDLMEIKESECRANSQAEVLRNALDEHSLELRVKAANEAEAACQQRLSAAEAEISHLRVELDASERDVLELTEAIRSKDVEAETYIAEIETIGQAYEDMQTQNQHLLQQVTERDDYNLKLVSESVKTKQAQSVLLSEKQALAKQLQQINASVESLKMRISHSEEQMETFLTEAIRSTQEERHLAVNLETAKWELADAEKELKWLKAAVASSEKEYEQIERDRDDLQSDFGMKVGIVLSRSSRKKLEEELMELNTKVAEMTSEAGEAAIQKLQDEIKSCKSILKCSVCSDRPKEVVIVKCYHLFCNPCIQKNLEIRHRKCPACGNAFGQNDVRFVKI
ncbi:E3 ubiquitin-protein ligase BRE1-like 2 [Morella rubra]|uniref:E3 ubiquitin protein ligase n=1 Tax=Morella rubra TaxID=262757 RepID=A0A6A1WW00_9ROSI|nr:E3 ubiquitin-protein ligase BRE1-like 2 [Morella rubra]